jgi:hypothetical protein
MTQITPYKTNPHKTDKTSQCDSTANLDRPDVTPDPETCTAPQVTSRRVNWLELRLLMASHLLYVVGLGLRVMGGHIGQFVGWADRNTFFWFRDVKTHVLSALATIVHYLIT